MVQIGKRKFFDAKYRTRIVCGLLFYNAKILSIHWNPVKFIIDNIFLIGIALLSGGALIIHTLQRSGAKLTPLQATQVINQGKMVILDVRDAVDFAAGHIRDAKNIPLKELKSRVAELDKFKTRPVVVVCSKGLQSTKATAQLKKAGFAEAYSLLGGLDSWQSQGLPTTK
jgi:rhodanese-related sulfurtransferase